MSRRRSGKPSPFFFFSKDVIINLFVCCVFSFVMLHFFLFFLLFILHFGCFLSVGLVLRLLVQCSVQLSVQAVVGFWPRAGWAAAAWREKTHKKH